MTQYVFTSCLCFLSPVYLCINTPARLCIHINNVLILNKTVEYRIQNQFWTTKNIMKLLAVTTIWKQETDMLY